MRSSKLITSTLRDTHLSKTCKATNLLNPVIFATLLRHKVVVRCTQHSDAQLNAEHYGITVAHGKLREHGGGAAMRGLRDDNAAAISRGQQLL